MSSWAEADTVIDELTEIIQSQSGSENKSAIIVITRSNSYIGETVHVDHVDGVENLTGTLTDQGDGTGKVIIYTTYVGRYRVFVDNDSETIADVPTLGTVAKAEINPYFLYGFHADGAITDPSTKVTYVEGCQNENFTPVHVDFETGLIDGGDWFDTEVNNGVADIKNAPFFFPRSCMLTYAGSVSYYLKETDESKKEDGTASEYNNTSFGGNCMMEWGQNDKIIYMKVVPDENDPSAGTYYFSDKKLDSDFRDDCFRDKNNAQVPHFYTSKYFGSGSASKMRSISGQANFVNDTAANEIAGARANGSDIWDTMTLAQWNLINGLLTLMAKSTNTQAVYGSGRCKSSNSSAINTGTMDKKGMFWGSNDETSGVKVFGMENWWGNLWRRIRGYINANGTIKVKLTRGTHDGSSASDYNTDGSGYITISDCTPAGTSGGYISEMKFTQYGMFAKTAAGSDTTQYCDGLWFNNSQSNYAFVGASWNDSGRAGALAVSLDGAPSNASTDYGSALSCTPLAAA